ncbi:MAG TPA: phage tail length tape measure family protein [Sphingobium sp.]
MDAAALSLSIDSSSVLRAANDLDRFSASAEKAGKASSNPQGSIARLAASVQSMNAKLGAIIGQMEKLNAIMATMSKAAQGGASANDNLARSFALADAHVVAYTQHLAAMATAQRDANAHVIAYQNHISALPARQVEANAHILAYRNHLTALPAAAGQAAVGINKLTSTAAASAGALQANTGNIAAQFQDIGVTAAMGMNPLIIGLQQGTQLSAVFAQSGGSMGSVLAGAFKQIANAQALATIGLVALVAAIIQMINWSALAQAALIGLADVLVDIAPYAVAAAAALALIYAPAIISGLATVIATIGKMALSLLALIPIPVLIVAGLTAIVAAAVHFRDDLTKYLGFDIVKAARDGINWVIGAFVGGFNGIKAAWDKLPSAIGDVVIQAANATLRAVENMVNGTVGLINGLTAKLPFGLGQNIQLGNVSFGKIDNPYAGAASSVGSIVSESVKAAQSVDYVGKAIDGVTALAAKGASKLREWAGAIGASDDKKKAGPKAGAVGKTDADKWADLIGNADKQQRALDQAGAQIGVYGQDLSRLKHEQELFNQAQDQGIKLTAAMNQELRSRAAAMAAKEYDNTRKAAAADGARWHEEQMRQLEVERGALGLTGEALAAYNYKQQLINRELAAGVALKDIDITKIAQQADAYAKAATANDATRKAIEDQRKAMEANRETVKGFFTDWINGVREGESVFKSFEKSILKALNNIIDQMISQMLNQMLGGMGGMGGGLNSFAPTGTGNAGGFGGGFGMGGLTGGLGGTIGGILGTMLGKGIADLFGSLFANGGTFGTSQKFAHGGAFDQAQRFANGGAFTNKIYNTPTLFRFANGAQLGEMGEAGPEAVMPLKRGPNGALGVQMHGGGSGRPSIHMGDVHINNSLAGAIGPDGLAAALQQSGERTVAQIRRDLQSMLEQLDRDGAII